MVVLVLNNLPAIQDMCFLSPSREDPLEEEMATHPSIPAWKIPWTEEPAGLQFMESQRLRHNWAANTFTFSLHLPYGIDPYNSYESRDEQTGVYKD